MKKPDRLAGLCYWQGSRTELDISLTPVAIDVVAPHVGGKRLFGYPTGISVVTG